VHVRQALGFRLRCYGAQSLARALGVLLDLRSSRPDSPGSAGLRVRLLLALDAERTSSDELLHGLN